MEPRIRRAHPDDYDEILELDRICFPYDAPPDVEQATWWIASVDGDPVAYAAARGSFVYSDVLYLSRAGVLPEARGNGLQRRLIYTREAWGRRMGFDHAWTDTNGVQSANNLIRCGYHLFRPSKPWGRSDSMYFKKVIKHPVISDVGTVGP